MASYNERLDMALKYYCSNIKADLELVALCFDISVTDLENLLILTEEC